MNGLENPTNIGIGAIILIQVGQVVKEALRSRKNGANSNCPKPVCAERMESMSKQTSELHQWHNHDDPDQAGVKIWWNPTKEMRELTLCLRDLKVTIQEHLKEMRKMNGAQR